MVAIQNEFCLHDLSSSANRSSWTNAVNRNEQSDACFYFFGSLAREEPVLTRTFPAGVEILLQLYKTRSLAAIREFSANKVKFLVNSFGMRV